MISRLSFFVCGSKDPVKATLITVVLVIHVILLSSLYLARPSLKRSETKKLTVKTWAQPQPKKTTSTTLTKKANTIPKAKSTPKKPETSTKLPVKKPSQTIKKQEPVKEKEKPTEIKKQKTAQEQRLKEIQERIAKIEAKSDRMSSKPEFIVPAMIALSTPATSEHIEEASFAEEDSVSFLVGYLQQNLQLPDVGEVQIQLTFRKDGSIEDIKVLKAESQKNKKYLEEHLTKLSFPSMNTSSKEPSRSFLLTFCNKF